jgi:hypothetical protein
LVEIILIQVNPVGVRKSPSKFEILWSRKTSSITLRNMLPFWGDGVLAPIQPLNPDCLFNIQGISEIHGTTLEASSVHKNNESILCKRGLLDAS